MRARPLAVVTATAALLLTSVSVAVPTGARPVEPAGAAANPWDAYNYSPASRTVRPKRVYRTSGPVGAPTAVLGGKPTTLTATGSAVTLDFGKEVGGLVTVHAAAGGPATQQLGLAFTESAQYTGTTSDASNGGSGPDGALTADLTPGASWTMPAEYRTNG